MSKALLEAQRMMRTIARNLEAQLIEFHARTGLTTELSVQWVEATNIGRGDRR